VNDEQVLMTIDNYITSHLYNYAIMIDGKWRCNMTSIIVM